MKVEVKKTYVNEKTNFLATDATEVLIDMIHGDLFREDYVVNDKSATIECVYGVWCDGRILCCRETEEEARKKCSQYSQVIDELESMNGQDKVSLLELFKDDLTRQLGYDPLSEPPDNGARRVNLRY